MSLEVLMSTPDVGALEQEYVARAIQSGWAAPAGPDLNAFESEVAERCGVPYAVALSSGTAALHLALVSWGVKPGDIVLASTLTFAATANAIRYVGAQPWFVDSDPVSGNIDPELLEQAIVEARAQGRNIAAIIPVDLLGKCVDYTSIERIAESHGIRVLCDSAEAFGATHAGRPAGGFGHASVLSFNGNKVMTTSGGGMLLTADEDLAAHVRYLSTQARQPAPHYEHTEIGYNYRLSNLLAALGRAQLIRLDGMMSRRRGWRVHYRQFFADCPGVRIFGGENDSEDNCWLTAISVDSEVAGWSVAELGEKLRGSGIETRPMWKPMHLQPVNADCPATLNGTADQIFLRGLTLPSGSAMTNAQFASVLTAIAGSGLLQ
ncbi:MAG: pyridoxal-5-phosphate-dependent protein [Marmoricola sp.]|jgi:dTDP-4-amino-4,6-dideoxygalactose transaminase|nr:pyridoxal-5-phosphate-dependent protein [Marmoricola sp.]